MDSSTAMRTLRNELPWKDWLIVDFLRYWYAIAVIALIVFLILSLARQYHVADVLGIAELFFVAVIVAVLGFLGYRLIWPEGGFTKKDTPRKRLRGLLGRKRKRFE